MKGMTGQTEMIDPRHALSARGDSAFAALTIPSNCGAPLIHDPVLVHALSSLDMERQSGTSRVGLGLSQRIVC